MALPKVLGYCKTIYDIPLSYFLSLQVKAVVADLDQTLASPFDLVPDKRARDFKESLALQGIELLIVSNNHESRVRPYGESLGVKYLYHARKWQVGRIRKFLENAGLKPSDCVFVGDQLLTDGRYVQKIQGRMILVDPLTKIDNIYTKFTRRFQERKKKRLKQKGRLGTEIRPERKEM